MNNRLHKIDQPYTLTSLSIYGITILFYTVVYMVLMVLPLFVQSQHSSFSVIGWVMGITMLASMLCRPLAGRLIDRFGASIIFFSALIIFAISLTGYFINSVIAYWFIRLIQGVVAACFSTAMEIITINLLSDRLRAQGLSLYSLATIIPTTFAPALTLCLQKYFSIKTLFVFFLSLGIVNAVLAFYLFKKLKSIDIISKSEKTSSFFAFLSNTTLMTPTMIMLLVSVANGAIFTFLPLYLNDISSSFASTYFLLQMITLVGTRFVSSRFLPSNGTLPLSVIQLLLLLLASSLFLIYLQPSNLILTGSAIVNGIAFALLYPTLLTFVSFHIHSDYKGYYLGLFIGGADFGFAMGAIVTGLIADASSLSMIFLFCAILAIIALPCCYSMRRHTHLPLNKATSL